MPRLLYVCAEGSPFITRGSRVLGTILDAGWDVDVLIPAGGLGRANVARDMGRDLAGVVHVHECPADRGPGASLVRTLTGEGYFGSAALEDSVCRLVGGGEYTAILVKESSPLGRVFGGLRRAGAHVPVACEMVEPRVPQVYDSLVTYGTWRTRLAGGVRRILPRLAEAERRWLPACDRIFTVVEEMKAYLLSHYTLESDRIAVVHNVEVLPAFDAIHEPGIPDREGAVRISHVGTFGPHRGIEVLIAATRLVAARTRTPFRLSIVGPPPAQASRLQAMCAQDGIATHVELVPFVPHRVAMQWIKESDVGVIPHADTEGIRTTIPFKLFQYMSAGVMCVASDVGGLGRIVRETGCGVTFPAGDPNALADRLVAAIEQADGRRAMGARGREAVERRYRWEIEADDYVQWLRGMASRGPAATEHAAVIPPSRQASDRS